MQLAMRTGLTHLAAGGVSVVLDTTDGGLPAVLHWGQVLGPLNGADLEEFRAASQAGFGDNRIDVPERVALLPAAAEGWVGRPGIVGSRAGEAFSPLFRLTDEQPVAPDAT